MNDSYISMFGVLNFVIDTNGDFAALKCLSIRSNNLLIKIYFNNLIFFLRTHKIFHLFFKICDSYSLEGLFKTGCAYIKERIRNAQGNILGLNADTKNIETNFVANIWFNELHEIRKEIFQKIVTAEVSKTNTFL